MRDRERERERERFGGVYSKLAERFNENRDRFWKRVSEEKERLSLWRVVDSEG